MVHIHQIVCGGLCNLSQGVVARGQDTHVLTHSLRLFRSVHGGLLHHVSEHHCTGPNSPNFDQSLLSPRGDRKPRRSARDSVRMGCAPHGVGLTAAAGAEPRSPHRQQGVSCVRSFVCKRAPGKCAVPTAWQTACTALDCRGHGCHAARKNGGGAT